MRRSPRRRRCRRWAVAAALGGAPAAGAAPNSGRTAIVSLGDSYISGEAGRWQGNSTSPLRDRDGTDRAAFDCTPATCSYDSARVYGGTAASGCDRSDVAEIKVAGIAVERQGEPRLLGRHHREHLPRQQGRQGVQGRGASGRSAALRRACGQGQAGGALDRRERPRVRRHRPGVHDRLPDPSAAVPHDAAAGVRLEVRDRHAATSPGRSTRCGRSCATPDTPTFA